MSTPPPQSLPNNTFPDAAKPDRYREELKMLTDRKKLKLEHKVEQDESTGAWWATYSVPVIGGYLGSANGTSKKIAMENAAEQAVKSLKTKF